MSQRNQKSGRSEQTPTLSARMPTQNHGEQKPGAGDAEK